MKTCSLMSRKIISSRGIIQFLDYFVNSMKKVFASKLSSPGSALK
eukprot:UN02346